MSKELYIDLIYEFVDRFEMRVKRLPVIAAAIVICSMGLALNALGLVAFLHQKSGLFDLKMIVVTINIALFSIFVLIEGNQYLFIKRLGKKIKEIELQEELIYKEVMEPKK